MRKYLVTFFIMCLSATAMFGQDNEVNRLRLVQISGVVVTSDSLLPVPFTSIMIRNTYRGTISDYYGFFSFVGRMGDTVDFSALGYKRMSFVIPDTITDHRCSLIQLLPKDTILLREVVIFPWPTKEQFKDAFLQLRIPDDDITRAQRNLDSDQLYVLSNMLPMDGSMNFKYQMEQQSARLYYSGQLPPNNLLNPIAWSKFIQMWQNGDFKKK